MAEFKFFCPQCGRQIQCDAGYTGMQINCPACHQAVVVPQAPRSGVARQPVPAKSRAARNVLVVAATVVVLAGLGLGGWYGYSKIRMHILRGHLPLGLVALWSGDGNANDSVGGNNGQLLHQAGFAAGKVGKAFVFQSIGDEVTTPATDLPAGTSDRTIDCWIYIKSFNNGAEECIAGYGTGGPGQIFSLSVAHGHRLVFTQWGDALDGSVLEANRWYNVAVTSVGTSSIKLYVNGVNVATGTLNFNTPADGEFWIGKIKSPYAPVQFYGLIDEIAVYNRALSDSEIQAIYREQK
jgi:Concanavalin A-like lectin/glucanases superfamily